MTITVTVFRSVYVIYNYIYICFVITILLYSVLTKVLKRFPLKDKVYKYQKLLSFRFQNPKNHKQILYDLALYESN